MDKYKTYLDSITSDGRYQDIDCIDTATEKPIRFTLGRGHLGDTISETLKFVHPYNIADDWTLIKKLLSKYKIPIYWTKDKHDYSPSFGKVDEYDYSPSFAEVDDFKPIVDFMDTHKKMIYGDNGYMCKHKDMCPMCSDLGDSIVTILGHDDEI
jgi:hypothetical protein